MGIWVEGRTEEANADQAKSDLKGAGQNSKDSSKSKLQRCFQPGEH